jgi:hypothetical protein
LKTARAHERSRLGTSHSRGSVATQPRKNSSVNTLKGGHPKPILREIRYLNCIAQCHAAMKSMPTRGRRGSPRSPDQRHAVGHCGACECRPATAGFVKDPTDPQWQDTLEYQEWLTWLVQRMLRGESDLGMTVGPTDDIAPTRSSHLSLMRRRRTMKKLIVRT